MVIFSYDCVEVLEMRIKIEHGYLSFLSNLSYVNNYFKYNKDYKTLEKMINVFGERLPEQEDIFEICCQSYNLKMIKMIVEKCCIEVSINNLFWVCRRRSKKIVKYLLNKIDVNKIDVQIRISFIKGLNNYKFAKIISKKFGDEIVPFVNSKNI